MTIKELLNQAELLINRWYAVNAERKKIIEEINKHLREQNNK